MKNIVKIIRIITFVVLIGSSMVACNNDTDDGESALIKYGELTVTGGGKIPIYKTVAVTDAQMSALVGGLNVVARVQAGYDAMTTSKGKLNTTNVSAIYISNIGYTGDGKYVTSSKVIEVAPNNTVEEMQSAFEIIATTDIP